MSRYVAQVLWERGDAEFLDNRYSRRHLLGFDGGARVPGSSSPLVVPPPASDPAGVDPEELLVASLSSCHMLWFLSIAAAGGIRVDRYQDDAEGFLDRNPEGRMAMTRVTLRPRARFSGGHPPAPEQVRGMHREAHERCYIASSVRTEVLCEPVVDES